MNEELPKVNVLGVGVTNATKKNILEYIVTSLSKKDQVPYYVVTPNPEIVMFARKHPSFRMILNNAKIALFDGVGLGFSVRLSGKSLKERFTGVDLVDSLCMQLAKKPITVGFLGGRGLVAKTTAECLSQNYPGLEVVFAGSEWKQGSKDSVIDVLFVAFGFPKQEEWMANNLDKGIYKVAIGVGGSFDYISGRVTRAPQVIRNFGFEWLYRLFRQPWRIKRQLVLPQFVVISLYKSILRSDNT